MSVPKSHEIAPLDLSVLQVMRTAQREPFDRSAQAAVGPLPVYLSGGKRKIIAASVYADRELEMKTGGPMRPQPIPATRPGRPRKKLKPKTEIVSAAE